MKEKLIKEIKITIEGEKDPCIIPDDENADTLKNLLLNDIYKGKKITFEKFTTIKKDHE